MHIGEKASDFQVPRLSDQLDVEDVLKGEDLTVRDSSGDTCRSTCLGPGIFERDCLPISPEEPIVTNAVG